jgi:hypothetical protein
MNIKVGFVKGLRVFSNMLGRQVKYKFNGAVK